MSKHPRNTRVNPAPVPSMLNPELPESTRTTSLKELGKKLEKRDVAHGDLVVMTTEHRVALENLKAAKHNFDAACKEVAVHASDFAQNFVNVKFADPADANT